MAFHFEFDAAKQLSVVIFSGSCDESEILRGVDALTHQKEFMPGNRVISDVRNADYTPEASTIKRFAEFHANHEHLKRCPVAIVVSKLVDYGMSNMFAILCQLKDFRVQSFLDRTKAERWLLTQSVPGQQCSDIPDPNTPRQK